MTSKQICFPRHKLNVLRKKCNHSFWVFNMVDSLPFSSPLVPFHTLSYASSYLSDCDFVFFCCTLPFLTWSLYQLQYVQLTIRRTQLQWFTHNGLFSPLKESPGTECPVLGCNSLTKATDSQIFLLFGPLDVASARPLHSQCDCQSAITWAAQAAGRRSGERRLAQSYKSHDTSDNENWPELRPLVKSCIVS